MNTTSFFLRTMFLFFSLLIFTNCSDSSKVSDSDTIYGSGKLVSQTRIVEECNGLVVQNIGNVYITQDENQTVRVEADDNIIDNVITIKEGENLLVGLKDGSYSNITPRIFVSLKNINELTINGAGNIVTDSDIQSSSMGCIINGAGNLTLNGNCNYLSCVINGAGNISAQNYLAKYCNAFVNGAGSITVNVSEELNASVDGAGSIIYFGNPPIVYTSINGLGSIKKGDG